MTVLSVRNRFPVTVDRTRSGHVHCFTVNAENPFNLQPAWPGFQFHDTLLVSTRSFSIHRAAVPHGCHTVNYVLIATCQLKKIHLNCRGVVFTSVVHTFTLTALHTCTNTKQKTRSRSTARIVQFAFKQRLFP